MNACWKMAEAMKDNAGQQKQQPSVRTPSRASLAGDVSTSGEVLPLTGQERAESPFDWRALNATPRNGYEAEVSATWLAKESILRWIPDESRR